MGPLAREICTDHSSRFRSTILALHVFTPTTPSPPLLVVWLTSLPLHGCTWLKEKNNSKIELSISANAHCYQCFQVRDEIEIANLARIYLKEMIKRECWDAMVVKGRSCNAFRMITSVTNYPMRQRSKEELDELQYVITQRKIENAEYEASKDLEPGPTSSRNTPVPGRYSTWNIWAAGTAEHILKRGASM